MVIADCESGLRPSAINHYDTNNRKSVGVFQVNGVHFKTWEEHAEMLDYKKNIKKAFEIYQKAKKKGTGWEPWPTCKKRLANPNATWLK